MEKKTCLALLSAVLLLLFSSCQKKSDNSKVSALLEPSISALTSTHLSAMESILKSEVAEEYYAIIGPFALPQGVILTEEFNTESSPYYRVQEAEEILYWAFDKRSKFIQKGKVFYFVFKNENLIQNLRFSAWPILLKKENNTFMDLGESEEFRNAHTLRDAQETLPNQKPSNELRNTLQEENPISSSEPVPSECCRFHKAALVVHTYKDEIFKNDIKNMRTALDALGYSVTAPAEPISSEDDLYHMIEKTRARFARHPSCCPAETCCGEIVVYVTGHGIERGISIEKQKTWAEWFGWTPYNPNPLVSYGRLANAFFGGISREQCLHLTLMLDACHSGAATDHLLAQPSCKICVYTSATRDGRSYGNWWSNDIAVCEEIYHGQAHSIEDISKCMNTLSDIHVIKDRDGNDIQAITPQKQCFPETP